jgi:hypothetical protein
MECVYSSEAHFPFDQATPHHIQEDINQSLCFEKPTALPENEKYFSVLSPRKIPNIILLLSVCLFALDSLSTAIRIFINFDTGKLH